MTEQLRVHAICEDHVHRALIIAFTHALLGEVLGEDASDAAARVAWCNLKGVAGDSPERSYLRFGGRPMTRVHGLVDGRRLDPQAMKVRAWTLDHARHGPPASLLVFLVDTDGHPPPMSPPEIVALLAKTPELPPVVVGTAHPEGEAWFFALPLESTERDRLAMARRALGWDPSKTPERLTSDPKRAHDAKRVFRFVFLGEGRRLDAGTPSSDAPDADQADAFADRLAGAGGPFAGFSACGLESFRKALHEALGELAPKIAYGAEDP